MMWTFSPPPGFFLCSFQFYYLRYLSCPPLLSPYSTPDRRSCLALSLFFVSFLWMGTVSFRAIFLHADHRDLFRPVSGFFFSPSPLPPPPYERRLSGETVFLTSAKQDFFSLPPGIFWLVSLRTNLSSLLTLFVCCCPRSPDRKLVSFPFFSLLSPPKFFQPFFLSLLFCSVPSAQTVLWRAVCLLVDLTALKIRTLLHYDGRLVLFPLLLPVPILLLFHDWE